MTYNDILSRMSVLGDALQLPLSAKALSATLLMRAHYAKGTAEWQTIVEQLQKDMPRKDGESDEDYTARLNELCAEKLKEETTLADRRYTPEVFEAVCAAAADKSEVESSVHYAIKDGKPAPAKVPAYMWLEYVAAKLVQEE